MTEQHTFVNGTEQVDGADELTRWTEHHKLEMEAKKAAAANADGEATVVNVGAQNGMADSDMDGSSPEKREADDVRDAMEAWTSANVHKVHEEPSAEKFLKSKLDEIAQSPSMLIAHKKRTISDDLADMHHAVKEWSISETHAFMKGNLEELTAAAKRAAEKATDRGEPVVKPQEIDGASSEGASILDSYMQGHDPEEFREMEKSQKKAAALTENPGAPRVPRVHRVPPGRFRWRGF